MLKEMVHTDVLRAIRTVHSGKRLMPQEVAERLSEYFPQVALTPREVEVLGLCRQGHGEQRDRRSAGDCERHHQDAHPEYSGKTGGVGSDARGDDRDPTWNLASGSVAVNARLNNGGWLLFLRGGGGGFGFLNGILLVQPTLDRFALGDRNHSLPTHSPGTFAVFSHQIRILVVNQNEAFLFRAPAVIRVVDFVMVVLH